MKFQLTTVEEVLAVSHPTRGAWIEILIGGKMWITAPVAPHTGCVD